MQLQYYSDKDQCVALYADPCGSGSTALPTQPCRNLLFLVTCWVPGIFLEITLIPYGTRVPVKHLTHDSLRS